MSHPLLNIFNDSNTIGVACKDISLTKAWLPIFDFYGKCATAGRSLVISISTPIAVSFFNEQIAKGMILDRGGFYPGYVHAEKCVQFMNFGYGTGLDVRSGYNRGRSNRWLETTIPFSCNKYGIAGHISDGYEVALTTVNP